MQSDKDTILYLDKGYVKFISSDGDDQRISTFARASFDEVGYDDPAKITNLINYLVEKEHTSPIEAGELTFQFKLPLMVRDQLVRHRTASMNIQSLRYSKHDGEFYIPELDRFCEQDEWNKQGSGEPLEKEVAEAYQDLIRNHSESSYKLYQTMIDKGGLARETARMVLGTNFYVTMAWKIDTKNLMHFLKLRDDPHAQPEIQMLAQIISMFFQREFPITFAAYEEFIKNSKKFPKTELSIIQELLSSLDQSVVSDTIAKSSLSKRRKRELTEFIYGEKDE